MRISSTCRQLQSSSQCGNCRAAAALAKADLAAEALLLEEEQEAQQAAKNRTKRKKR